MNWYKKAQKIPTMENIIWAIDKLIAENDEFSLEELAQGADEQQYALPKAAQTATKQKRVLKPKSEFNNWYNNLSYEEQKSFDEGGKHLAAPTKRKNRRGVGPKLENISETQTSKIFDLFEKGTSTKDISTILGVPATEISLLLKTRFPKKTDRDEYLKEKYEEKILSTTEDMSQEMMTDFNRPAIGQDEIASVLNIDVKFIIKVLKKNNINLQKLVGERSKIISANIEQITKELPPGFKAKDIILEFKKRYNFTLSPNKAYAAMTLNNLGEKNKNDPDTIFKAFTTYMSRMIKGGRGIFQTQPEKLPIYIDRFFQDYGEKHGFIPPYEQQQLKLYLTKMQMRENTLNMEKNKYTPVDYSENNPATFLYNRDQGQNELV